MRPSSASAPPLWVQHQRDTDAYQILLSPSPPPPPRRPLTGRSPRTPQQQQPRSYQHQYYQAAAYSTNASSSSFGVATAAPAYSSVPLHSPPRGNGGGAAGLRHGHSGFTSLTPSPPPHQHSASRGRATPFASPPPPPPPLPFTPPTTSWTPTAAASLAPLLTARSNGSGNGSSDTDEFVSPRRRRHQLQPPLQHHHIPVASTFPPSPSPSPPCMPPMPPVAPLNRAQLMAQWSAEKEARERRDAHINRSNTNDEGSISHALSPSLPLSVSPPHIAASPSPRVLDSTSHTARPFPSPRPSPHFPAPVAPPSPVLDEPVYTIRTARSPQKVHSFFSPTARQQHPSPSPPSASTHSASTDATLSSIQQSRVARQHRVAAGVVGVVGGMALSDLDELVPSVPPIMMPNTHSSAMRAEVEVTLTASSSSSPYQPLPLPLRAPPRARFFDPRHHHPTEGDVSAAEEVLSVPEDHFWFSWTRTRSLDSNTLELDTQLDILVANFSAEQGGRGGGGARALLDGNKGGGGGVSHAGLMISQQANHLSRTDAAGPTRAQLAPLLLHAPLPLLLCLLDLYVRARRRFSSAPVLVHALTGSVTNQLARWKRSLAPHSFLCPSNSAPQWRAFVEERIRPFAQAVQKSEQEELLRRAELARMAVEEEWASPYVFGVQPQPEPPQPQSQHPRDLSPPHVSSPSRPRPGTVKDDEEEEDDPNQLHVFSPSRTQPRTRLDASELTVDTGEAVVHDAFATELATTTATAAAAAAQADEARSREAKLMEEVEQLRRELEATRAKATARTKDQEEEEERKAKKEAEAHRDDAVVASARRSVELPPPLLVGESLVHKHVSALRHGGSGSGSASSSRSRLHQSSTHQLLSDLAMQDMSPRSQEMASAQQQQQQQQQHQVFKPSQGLTPPGGNTSARGSPHRGPMGSGGGGGGGPSSRARGAQTQGRRPNSPPKEGDTADEKHYSYPIDASPPPPLNTTSSIVLFPSPTSSPAAVVHPSSSALAASPPPPWLMTPLPSHRARDPTTPSFATATLLLMGGGWTPKQQQPQPDNGVEEEEEHVAADDATTAVDAAAAADLEPVRLEDLQSSELLPPPLDASVFEGYPLPDCSSVVSSTLPADAAGSIEKYQDDSLPLPPPPPSAPADLSPFFVPPPPHVLMEHVAHFLLSASPSLFASEVQSTLSTSDAEYLVQVGGGSPWTVLQILESLRRRRSPPSQPFDSFQQLLEAVHTIQSYRDARRAFLVQTLSFPRCTLFAECPSRVLVESWALDQLVDCAPGGQEQGVEWIGYGVSVLDLHGWRPTSFDQLGRVIAGGFGEVKTKVRDMERFLASAGEQEGAPTIDPTATSSSAPARLLRLLRHTDNTSSSSLLSQPLRSSEVRELVQRLEPLQHLSTLWSFLRREHLRDRAADLLMEGEGQQQEQDEYEGDDAVPPSPSSLADLLVSSDPPPLELALEPLDVLRQFVQLGVVFGSLHELVQSIWVAGQYPPVPDFIREKVGMGRGDTATATDDASDVPPADLASSSSFISPELFARCVANLREQHAQRYKEDALAAATEARQYYVALREQQRIQQRQQEQHSTADADTEMLEAAQQITHSEAAGTPTDAVAEDASSDATAGSTHALTEPSAADAHAHSSPVADRDASGR